MIIIEGRIADRRVLIDGVELDPKPSQAIINHSPDGFSWGYCGSGPAQLALAILIKFIDQETALKLYQHFKFNVVARWPQGNDFGIPFDLEQWFAKNKSFLKDRS